MAPSTDETWRFYGDVDPYFGVLTAEQFRGSTLSSEDRDEFFATGREHVAHVFDLVRESFDKAFRPQRALDFGCGVGRLAIPMAERSGAVVGVDISEGMLAEADKNARAFGMNNITFAVSDDALSRVHGSFDFVHSFIVFQHIPPARGNRIIRELVIRLNEGGIGALQVTIRHEATRLRRGLVKAYHLFPWLYGARNLVKGEPFSNPLMQMNAYQVNDILAILKEFGAHKVSVHLTETSHFGAPLLGAIILFQKAPGSQIISA